MFQVRTHDSFVAYGCEVYLTFRAENVFLRHSHLQRVTLPETNESPLKMVGRFNFLLEWPIFMRCVSFKVGISFMHSTSESRLLSYMYFRYTSAIKI